MDCTIGTARSVQIEWKYGLTALTDMIGLTLPRGLRPQVIAGFADWSERINTGRVLQLAMGDMGNHPRYVRPGRSALDFAWTTKRGVIRQESIGHPTLLNQHGQVVQNEVYVDRQVTLRSYNGSICSPELEWDEFTYHVGETTNVELVPFRFDALRNNEGGNLLANRIANQMTETGHRPATLTEILWYAAKFQDEIEEDQILVPWAGFSGGFWRGQQHRHHLGLPFVVRRKGILNLTMSEFLGQHMSVSQGTDYLAVKI